MRTTLKLVVFMYFASQVLFAQPVKILQQPVKISKGNSQYSFARIAPDGMTIAASHPDLHGIVLLAADGSEIKQISDADGSGWNFSWSPDSRKLAFRENHQATDGRSSVIIVTDNEGNLLTKSQSMLNSSLPYWGLKGSKLMYHQEDKNWNTITLDKNSDPVIAFQGKQIFVFNELRLKNGLENLTFPAEILNMAVSPDGSRYCFEVSGYGLYVYDATNNSTIDLGTGEFPCWINNEYFVYMRIKDDGAKILQSDIMLKKYNGNDEVNLTESFKGIALYPSCSNSGTVVFTTDTNELYVMKILVP